MNFFQKIPVVRSLYRYIREIVRDAPLEEFANYDEYWDARIRENRVAPVLDRYVQIASRVRPNASLLDIGCGEGAFLQYMRKARPDCRLAGADISSYSVAHLLQNGIEAKLIAPGQRVKDACGNGWDVVVLMEVIEHIVDAEETIRQVVELEPAQIFITVPNVGFMLYRLRLMFGSRFPITSIFYHMKEHVRFWTVKDFRQWSEVNGLQVIACVPQIDRGDQLVRFLARLSPSMFADRVVYELRVRVARNEQPSIDSETLRG